MLLVIYTPRVPDRLTRRPHRRQEEGNHWRKNREDGQHLKQRESASRSRPGMKWFHRTLPITRQWCFPTSHETTTSVRGSPRQINWKLLTARQRHFGLRRTRFPV